MPAQADGTATTVMMYMCGTDLQSDCVMDMYEMCEASFSDDINIIVQAGGASQWDDDNLTPYALNRFTVSYGDFSDMKVLDNQSMGDQQTLMDFLDWGTSNYPADRYVLVFWDHGGGSAAGVCFDETADNDSLTLHEINDALYEFYQTNPDFPLDIVGFDACLMATYENAAHLRHYANYMVASEELEPGIGWYYTGWLSKLCDDPDMDSQSLAVAIADAYMEACTDENPDDYLQHERGLPACHELLGGYHGDLRRLSVSGAERGSTGRLQPRTAAHVLPSANSAMLRPIWWTWPPCSKPPGASLLRRPQRWKALIKRPCATTWARRSSIT